MNPEACAAIDHVVVRARQVPPLLDLFTKVLGLPVVWPLRVEPFATYAWVSLGNTCLELWAATDNRDLPAEAPLPMFQQVALEPTHLGDALEQLQRAGVACKTPRTFSTPDASGQPCDNFTNAVVQSLSGPACCVFFCDWGLRAPIVPWPAGLTAAQRRSARALEFARCGGGRLGLTGLSEITLGVPDVAAARRHWQAVTGSGEGMLRVGGRTADDADAAVAIRLVQADGFSFQSLTLATRSLAHARRELAAAGLLEARAAADDTTMLSLAATGGLQIRLV